jgi:hypothetical protein
MAVTFRRRITWPKNDLLLPAELYNVTAPAGLGSLDVRAPNIIDMTKMMQLDPGGGANSSGSLSMTEGLVKPNLSISFPNPSAQWRRSSPPGVNDPSHGPCLFQFVGGEVLLDLTLEIYLLDTAEVDPNDDLSVRIFACLYEHELLHVLDALDIANNWLPPRLNTEPTLARYLVQGQPYTYGTPAMLSAQLEREFQTFITNTIQVAVFNLWATESNRRESLRDAPAQYKLVQDKVDELRARQINRPHH